VLNSYLKSAQFIRFYRVTGNSYDDELGNKKQLLPQHLAAWSEKKHKQMG
jgi:hypothetical protein